MKSGFLHRFNRQLPQQPRAWCEASSSAKPQALEVGAAQAQSRWQDPAEPGLGRLGQWDEEPGIKKLVDFSAKSWGDFSATKSWGDLIQQHTPTWVAFFMGFFGILGWTKTRNGFCPSLFKGHLLWKNGDQFPETQFLYLGNCCPKTVGKQSPCCWLCTYLMW